MLREALIVLGKCYWYTHHYKEAYTVLNKVTINSLDNLSFHHQKLLVDFYAFYGMISLLNLVSSCSLYHCKGLCQEYAGQLDDALGSYDKCLDMLINLAIHLETCLYRSDIQLPHSIYIAIVKGTILCLNERLRV